ncbi:MAG: hypothetical protein QM726_18125 [Chitinophagaceae bacterium]
MNSQTTRKGMSDKVQQHPASYRDPAGFIFKHDGKVYRQVNQYYAQDYDLFIKSGLYDLLVKQKKILPHLEIGENFTGDAQWYKTLLPEQLEFISYPYEWCFSQWKDAALLTLELVKTAVSHGLVLKDATPFNVQFVSGAAVFIDTLSFEKYNETKPWVAYRQFIECFVGPLLLAKYRSSDLLKLFQVYPDGIPLKLISKLLPTKSMFNANVFLHIKIPGLVNSKPGREKEKQPLFTKQKLLNIIANLQSFVESISLPATKTSWNNYYEETILSHDYAKAKLAILEEWLKDLPGKTLLDIGTNTGMFAKAAANAGKFTVAIDSDHACIDQLYNDKKEQNGSSILPLCVDIANPSPAIGWSNAERASFTERAKADIVMALALVHHLAIGKNISFEQIAAAFEAMAPVLIIEFVPKEDEKVQLLLKDRKDIFDHYCKETFEKVFSNRLEILKVQPIPGTGRMLYLMKRKC